MDGNTNLGQHVLRGEPEITVTLRRSSRAKRLSLRVSRLDGRVTLTLPNRAPEREAIAFLKTREDWLRGHLAQVAQVVVPAIGAQVLFRGQTLPLIASTDRTIRVTDDGIYAPDDAQISTRLKAYFKATARDALAQASDHYAAALGLRYTRLTLRDTRSRWGSCNSAGGLMYSWRLIMAPPKVLNYVAAHEVAHLVEMNHSPAFWGQVARVMPDYETPRRWLRDNGDQLHRLQFND